MFKVWDLMDFGVQICQNSWNIFIWETPWTLAAATAAMSLQLCPTLCDPIDGSPPGSTVPGILQARTLEWVMNPWPYSQITSICFEANCFLVYPPLLKKIFIYLFRLRWVLLRHVRSSIAAPWACGIFLPWWGIKPTSPALQGRFLTLDHQGNSLTF